MNLAVILIFCIWLGIHRNSKCALFFNTIHPQNDDRNLLNKFWLPYGGWGIGGRGVEILLQVSQELVFFKMIAVFFIYFVLVIFVL